MVDGVHVLDQLQNLVGVADLVVVPGNDLHEGVGQSDAGVGVEDGGAGVAQTFPSRYCSTIGHQVVFSLMGWSPLFHTRFHVPRITSDTTSLTLLSITGLSPSLVSFPTLFF